VICVSAASGAEYTPHLTPGRVKERGCGALEE